MAGRGRGNGEGSISKIKTPAGTRYLVRVSVPGSGGTKRKSKIVKTQAQAQEEKRRLLKEVSGLTFTPETLTFGEHLDNWLETVARDRVKGSTLVRYEGNVRNHLKPTLGHIKLKDITPAHLQTLYAQKMREGLASGTVRQMHAVAGSALKQARKWKLIEANPAEDADAPRLVPKRQSKALSREDASRLLERILAWRKDLYALFLIAIATGMRQGEILGLTWSHVNLEKGEANIERTADTWSGPPSFRAPKGGKGRSITLPSFALEALKVHRKAQLETRMMTPHWRERDLIFPGPTGDVIRRAVLYQSFTRFLKREGFPEMTFHELRHGCATILLEAGESMKAIQELLGHQDIRITMNTYAHLTERMKTSVAETMDGLLGS